jgi:Tfp pilus assembly protein PilF
MEVQYPARAEPKVWHGIILSTKAGIDGGLSALSDVKKAKVLFEQAIAIDEGALEGSAYTSLATLYYQVPSWPIAFGDDEQAEVYFKKAMSISPHGIDTNFFYGEYLAKQHREDEAKQRLNHALAAPARPDRPLADIGRRQEIKSALAELK